MIPRQVKLLQKRRPHRLDLLVRQLAPTGVQLPHLQEVFKLFRLYRAGVTHVDVDNLGQVQVVHADRVRAVDVQRVQLGEVLVRERQAQLLATRE